MATLSTVFILAFCYYLISVFISKVFVPSPVKESMKEIIAYGFFFVMMCAGTLFMSIFLLPQMDSEILVYLIVILILVINQTKQFLIKPYIYALFRKKAIVEDYIQYAHEQGCRAKVITVPKLINALAMGVTPGSHCIIIGEGLKNCLTAEELNGVVSHEIAHLKYGHIKVLLLLCVVTSFIYLGLNSFVRINYIMNAEIAAVTAAFSAFVGLVITSFPMRYCEKQADKYAATMVGKETYISALKKLNEATNGSMERFDWNHPLLKTRIQYIEQSVQVREL